MDQASLQFLSQQTGMGALAIFALIMLKRSYDDRDKLRAEQIEREKMIAQEKKEDRDTLLVALQQNTAAMTSIQQIVARCTRVQ